MRRARPADASEHASRHASGAAPSTGVRRAVVGVEVLAVVLVVGSCLLGAVLALVDGWVPMNDSAFIEMRVRDVPAHFPLLGVYSRFGWSHPGPAQFVWLAAPYRLLGSSSAALLAGTLALHAAAVVAAWAVARRLDRVAGLLVLIACEVVLLAAPAAQVRSPWNPYVSLVAGATLVVCGWGAAQRRPVATALVLPVGTLLLQAHAANLGLVVGVVVAAAAGAAAGWRRSGSDPTSGPTPPVTPPVTPPITPPATPPVPWRALAIGAAVSFVAWIPPIVAQLTGEPGRISEMLTGGAAVRRPVGVGEGIGTLLDAFSLVPSWARPSSFEGFARTSWTVPVWLVVVIVGLVVAVRRGDRLAVRGIAVGLAATTSAAIITSLVTDGLFHYLVVGVRGAGAATVAIGVVALVRALPARSDLAIRMALGVLAVALGSALIIHQARGHNPEQAAGPQVTGLTDAVLARPAPDHGYLIVPEPAWVNGSEALMVELERAGIDVAVGDRGLATAVGAHRVGRAGDGREEITVTTAGNAPRLTSEGWRVLATTDAPVEGSGNRLIVAVRPAAQR